MDETAVKIAPVLKPGLVACEPQENIKDFMLHERRAPLRQQRACLSLVAFVCDDSEVQKSLPQIILGGSAVLRVSDLVRIEPQLPDNVFCLRRKSAWLNADLLAEIVKLLGKSLTHLRNHRTFILSMDAAPSHTKEKVAKACARQNIHIMYIPAQMTKWLQPLDTHVFAKLKRFLQQEYETAVLRERDGEVNVFDVLQAVVRAVPEVLEAQPWSRAFQHVGLRDEQTHLSRTFLRRLGWHAAPQVPPDLPTLQELQAVFKAGFDIPVGALFESLLPRPAAVVARRAAPRDDAGEGHGGNPWRGRLRSSSRVDLLPPAEASQAPAAPRAPRATRLGIPRSQWGHGSIPLESPERDRSRSPPG